MVIILYVGSFIFMEYVSKLVEAISNAVSAGQSGDYAELAKSIGNIVVNGVSIAEDIAKALGYM